MIFLFDGSDIMLVPCKKRLVLNTMSSRWVARLEELCGYDISTNISFLLFDPPAERYGIEKMLVLVRGW